MLRSLKSLATPLMLSLCSLAVLSCRTGSGGTDSAATDTLAASQGKDLSPQQIATQDKIVTRMMGQAGYNLYGVGYIVAGNSAKPDAPVRYCIAPSVSHGGMFKVAMIQKSSGIKKSCELFRIWARPVNPNIRRFTIDNGHCLFDAGYQMPIGQGKCPTTADDPDAKYTFNWDNHSEFRAIKSERGNNPLCWDKGESDSVVRLWNCKWNIFRGDNQTWLFHGKMIQDSSMVYKDLYQ